MLIGLTGKKRRGKDTVANYLVTQHGFNRHGFADKVKAYLYAINPLIMVTWPPEKFTLDTDMSLFATTAYGRATYETFFRLQYIVDTIGWEKAKEIPEVRQLLQRTGTEGGRSIFWKDFWVDVLFKELEEKYDIYYSGGNLDPTRMLQSNIVISDCRFDNEAERIKQYGGIVIKVDSNREGLPEPDNHDSEKDISPLLVDGTLHNDVFRTDGEFPELYAGIEEMLSKIKG